VKSLPAEVRHDEAALRKLLAKPFKGKITPAVVKRHQAEQAEILFALYKIEPDWPDEIKWYRLAMSLAAVLYPACRMPDKPPGGRTEEREEKQRILFREFEALCLKLEVPLPCHGQKRPKGFAASAESFWKGKHIKSSRLKEVHQKALKEAGFKKSGRSFTQAAEKFIKKYPAWKMMDATRDSNMRAYDSKVRTYQGEPIRKR
jgi:hypothetical protein